MLAISQGTKAFPGEPRALARTDDSRSEDSYLPLAAADRSEEAKKAFDTFYAKVWPRRDLIEAELKAGRRERWEGKFSNGSSFFPQGWIMSRKAGYVSTSRLIDMGRVDTQGDRIALVSESPAKPASPWMKNIG